MAAALMLAAGAPAVAVSGGDQPVRIDARDLPVAEAIRLAYAGQPITVLISAKVRGRISGQLIGRPHEILARLQREHGLLVFIEDRVVNVHAAVEHAKATFVLNPDRIDAFLDTVRQLDLPPTGTNQLRTAASGAVFVSGSPRYVERVAALRESFAAGAPARAGADRAARGARGADAAPQAYRLYRLSYAWAEDVRSGDKVIPGVASILRSLVTGKGGEATKGPPAAQLSGAQRVQSLALPPPTPLTSPSNRDGFTGWEEPPAAAPSRVPEVPGEGAPRIEADPRQNAIIVLDDVARMPLYDALIAKLDIEARMIEIEATIIDIDTRKIDALGLNWRLGIGDAAIGFGRPGVDSPPSAGFNLSAVVSDGDGLSARLTALREEGAAKIVSRPQVLTMANVEAVLTARRTFYVRAVGERTADLFSIDVGTVLRVTPHVVHDGDRQLVRLFVNIEDGAPANDSVDQIPAINRTRIDASVLLNANESILLGGLTVETDSKATEKAPILGDVPVVGLLFKRQRTEKRKTERLFLISPRVAPRALERLAALP